MRPPIPPSAPADGETALCCRPRSARPIPRLERRAGDAESLGRTPTAGPDRRSAPPRRRATAAECPRGAPPAAAGSSPRSDPTATAQPAIRTRPPAAPAEPSRQLQQRQRVSSRLGEELVGDPLVQPPRNHRRKQRSRVGVHQSPSTSSGRPASFVARLPRGEQHHHRSAAAFSRRTQTPERRHGPTIARHR